MNVVAIANANNTRVPKRENWFPRAQQSLREYLNSSTRTILVLFGRCTAQNARPLHARRGPRFLEV